MSISPPPRRNRVPLLLSSASRNGKHGCLTSKMRPWITRSFMDHLPTSSHSPPVIRKSNPSSPPRSIARAPSHSPSHFPPILPFTHSPPQLSQMVPPLPDKWKRNAQHSICLFQSSNTVHTEHSYLVTRPCQKISSRIRYMRTRQETRTASAIRIANTVAGALHLPARVTIQLTRFSGTQNTTHTVRCCCQHDSPGTR